MSHPTKGSMAVTLQVLLLVTDANMGFIRTRQAARHVFIAHLGNSQMAFVSLFFGLAVILMLSLVRRVLCAPLVHSTITLALGTVSAAPLRIIMRSLEKVHVMLVHLVVQLTLLDRRLYQIVSSVLLADILQ